MEQTGQDSGSYTTGIGAQGPAQPVHGSMGAIGAKLSDPTSDLWALVFNFQGPTFYDGNLNTGNPETIGDAENSARNH